MRSQHFITATLTALIIILFSCSWSAVYAAEGDVTSIEMNLKVNTVVYMADTPLKLKLYANLEGQTEQKVITDDAIWTSSNPGVIEVSNGTITPILPGTATITAKYGTHTASLHIESKYMFSDFLLNEEDPIQTELDQTSIQLSVQGKDDQNVIHDLTQLAAWTSSETQVASVNKGKVTFLAQGSTTISASYKGMEDTVKINISLPFTDLQIDHDERTEFLVDEEVDPFKLRAVLEGGQLEAVQENMTWTSSDPNIVSIDDEGQPTFKAEGQATIRAVYLGSPATVDLIVRQPYEAMTLEPAKDFHVLRDSDAFNVKAFVNENLNTKTEISEQAKWVSSNPVAVTVTNGIITPMSTGESTITVTYRGLSSSFKVKVYPTLTGITPAEDNIELFKGEVISLPQIKGTTLAGASIDVSPLIQWSSADESIASIENGEIIANQLGSTEITATLLDYETTIPIQINEKILTLLSPATKLEIRANRQLDLPDVYAVSESGEEKRVTDRLKWTTSNSNILVVDGKLKGVIGGASKLTGTYLNQTISMPVIIQKEYVQFRVEPEKLQLNLDDKQQLKVIGVYRDGSEKVVTREVKWTSANEKVAAIDEFKVIALSKGSTYLTGTFEGHTLTVDVNVVAELKKLITDETSFKLNVGDEISVNVSALYDTGGVVDITEEAVWRSSNESIVKANEGTIKALKKGDARIKVLYKNEYVWIRIKVQ